MIAIAMVLLAGGQQATSAAADAKVRCRVETVTGSLAQRTRICHTAAEWKALDEAGNKSARDIIERGQQSCGDCSHG